MQTTEDLAQLDHLLEELGQEPGAQCELLREHLESARIQLTGSMPAEYQLTLELARDAVNCVADVDLRARIEQFIREELRGTRHRGT